ncbi:MAG: undecaprenyldiphospho-muramoylpentapeptide beta-N-acetylglucosaminyltransferase [Clostridia bacterium]|nr:undecaprenyldiphospho-muramoylpentapeptide beta-N-acetylglucosaminyltransferase [Clostridia bacterium]
MNIIFVAGGTAGHLNPALALAQGFKKKDSANKILFVGTPDKIESTKVPQAGFDFKSMQLDGFRRRLSFGNILHNFINLFRLIKAFFTSKKIISDFNPDLVIGFGGYISYPLLFVANLMNIKTAIHEQNSFPGLANKKLSNRVDLVMLTNSDCIEKMKIKNKVVITGLPVRNNLLSISKTKAREKLNITDDKIVILSVGGSLGATPINNVISELIIEKFEDDSLVFLHSTGNRKNEFVEKLKDKNVKLSDNIRIYDYIDDMDLAMNAADIVISRSGASSVAEIEALSKASILIPSPYVAENHQYFNAQTLEKRDGAFLIEEKKLNLDSLTQKLNILISDVDFREKMGENANLLYNKNVIDDMINSCEEILRN